MTLLGVPPAPGAGFSMGSTNTSNDLSMGQSLDQMIESRRKEQAKVSRRGPKKASIADQTVGRGRAKRQAAAQARRGLVDPPASGKKAKPTAMDIEREVYRQVRRSERTKQAAQKKQSGRGRVAPDSTKRKANKKQAKKVKVTTPKKNTKKKATPANNRKAATAKTAERAAPKKATTAAQTGMKAAGFTAPTGYKVQVSYVKEEKGGKKKTPAKKTTVAKRGTVAKKKGGAASKKKVTKKASPAKKKTTTAKRNGTKNSKTTSGGGRGAGRRGGRK